MLRLFVSVVVALGCLPLLCGCSHAPESLRHVTAAELKVQHPACLQQMNTRPPKAFLILSEAGLKQFWGQGGDPPTVNFQKRMVFVAFTSLGSDGPGTMEVWVLKYRQREDLMEVRVREDLTGAWPLSTGFSRAYDIVALPKTTNPVKVVWEYHWGNRNETRELRAQEWLPKAGGSAGGQGGQGPSGGWSGAVQPQAPGQSGFQPRWPGASEQPH